MIKSKLFLLFLLAPAFLLIACSKNSDNANDDNSGGSGGTTNPGPLFTAVKALMQTSCTTAGCHAGAGAAGGVNLTQDGVIVAQKDRIKVRAVDQAATANRMPQPPNPALPAADQKKITDWVTAGGRLTD